MRILSNGDLMLYWSTGEPSVNNIVQELEALGQFGDWFYKEHKDIYQKIIVETLYTIKHNRYF